MALLDIWKMLVKRRLRLAATTFFALSGLQMLLSLLTLAGWVPTAINWISGVPSVWVGLAIFIPLIMGGLLLLESRLPKLRSFDMTAREAAEYVMQNLGMDIYQATDFVTRKVGESEVHLRAMKVGDAFHALVSPNIFDTHKMFLIGDATKVAHAKQFKSAFFEEGWIELKISGDLRTYATHTSLHFIPLEIEAAVAEEKLSRHK
ncbi:MAG: hypothetical protein HY851_03970 [candidate division Zixibacteria bacterium]|nr:hypothetical protein [candidate division Zixibacteria bacterium]